jgi:hypothetical protein
MSRQITEIRTTKNTTTILSPDQRVQATQGGQLTAAIQNLYSIVLYDTVADKTFAVDGHLDPAKRTHNAEYFFRVPPKVHEFDEPFATTIINTQYGGKYVESFGSILKSIRISGTTGIRPNKIAPTKSILGVTQNQVDLLLGQGLNTELRTIPKNEATGHDDIIFLRNIFRKYSDIKDDPSDLAGRIVMLWRNVKDADYWVVEPEDFRLSQNSSSPLTYEYSISLKTLARFDFVLTLDADPLEAARRQARLFSRVQEYGQNILNIFLTISTQITRVAGYANFISTTVLAPMLNVLNGLSAVATASRNTIKALQSNLKTLSRNIDDAITRFQNEAVLPVQDIIMNSLRRASVTVAHASGEPAFRDSHSSDLPATLGRRTNAYTTEAIATRPRRAPEFSPTYIGTEQAPESAASALVGPGEDLRDIADRLLGDRARWRLLATMNGLRAPYISPLGGPGVLMPGDTIMVPGTGVRFNVVVGASGTSPDESDNNAQANAENQLAYGRDLRLKSVMHGSEELTDLVINQRGDLGAIQGVPNVEQAIRIKFYTQRGELPAHPKFGAKVAIGRKATPTSFAELRINAMSTLMSDSRVKEVRDLKFISYGDALSITSNVVLTNSQDSMSTSFALRRF